MKMTKQQPRSTRVTAVTEQQQQYTSCTAKDIYRSLNLVFSPYGALQKTKQKRITVGLDDFQ